MRLIIQRVNVSSVKVNNEIIGSIDKGLLVLLGVQKGDTEGSVFNLVKKFVNLRILADKEKKMNHSLLEMDQEVLLISQFTLFADTTKGNRPSFIDAEEPEKARELYELFYSELKEKGVKVAKGMFGEYMHIETILDGPVTILLEG